eukprot:TRINITY_DN3079_c0_g1_i2.p1 TRINITY_DN3079_c0_g1~~TRINITY_DN3079_c0_g1_i2.p1  ORF type:complete len:390 (+),score=105.04 TRINITY_DN3079_c0_g1_i2:56-1171(+)
MQDAMKIKSEQMAKERRKYDSWPTVLKNTLLHPRDIQNKRQVSLQERVDAANALKDVGKEEFQKGSFLEASDQYAHAYGLFHYVKNNDPNWQKKGIFDRDLEIVLEKGDSEEMKENVYTLRTSCLLNIALCELKMNNKDACVSVCDMALEIDNQLVKAHYRKAMAKILSVSSGTTDLESALKDLEMAKSIDPESSAVINQYETLKHRLATQKARDKSSIGRALKRGNIYKDEEIKESKPLSADEAHKLEMERKQRKTESELKAVEEAIARFKSEGRYKEAEELQDFLDQRTKRVSTGLDFANPTPQMIEDAAKMGVDLNDPQVRRELKRLADLRERGVDPMATPDLNSTFSESDPFLNMKVEIAVCVQKYD